MAYGNGKGPDPLPQGGVRAGKGGRGRGQVKKPITSIKKAITYSSTVNDILLDISKTASATAQKSGDISEVRVRNEGYVPVFAIFKYALWDDSTTLNANARYVHYLLDPQDQIVIPTSRAIIGDHDTVVYDGTALADQTPDSNMYKDSTADSDDGSGADITDSASSTNIFIETDTHTNFFRVGDLIRVNNEIMEVTAVGDDSDAANTNLTVIRGVHGSTAASDHADDAAIRFAFFNQHHEFDKFSVVQTDINGAYKSSNFFGEGRSATEGQGGIVPGSVVIGPFYNSGYQELGMTGVTPNTETGLTVSTNYMLDIQVDGGTNFDNLSFTTDATNTRFGGSTGLIVKIQDALDEQYYTTGSNLLEKGVTVSIINGDVRFTSHSRLSGSAIALTVEDGSGTSLFGVGRIPAQGSIDKAVPARFPDEKSYNPITYGTTYNNVFIRDDGKGNLWSNGFGTGRINYESGAWEIMGAPSSAEFKYSVLHSSPFSGKLDATATGKQNQLQAVLGNLPNQRCEGLLRIETF